MDSPGYFSHLPFPFKIVIKQYFSWREKENKNKRKFKKRKEEMIFWLLLHIAEFKKLIFDWQGEC